MPPEILGTIEIDRRREIFEWDLDVVKAAHPEVDWYPYYSLSFTPLLDQLLNRLPGGLLEMIGGEPVADIGCADGDVAFFLESLGCQVHAIDNPPTNYNGLRGIHLLKKVLSSSVEIHSLDLDSQFVLPLGRYGLVIFLGILYHLKNPYYALEKIARTARYCLLSTRIARFSPDGHTDLRDLPVAYLLGEGETNNDSTNYWIFSDAGLRRILHRTGWALSSYITTGTDDSDPVSPTADQRAFCLIESRFVLGFGAGVQFCEGWHSIEEGGWRWTQRRFSARLRAPDEGKEAVLRLHLTVTEALIQGVRAVKLRAKINRVKLPSEKFSKPGSYVYERRLPRESLNGEPVLVEFELDHALSAHGMDQRELGLIVSSIGID